MVKNPLYLVGRSYGGHWATALAYVIAQADNKVGNTSVNLAGLISCDGLINDGNQSHWSDFLYAAGQTTPYWRDQ